MKKRGEKRQQMPETANWMKATHALPTRAETSPPTLHPTLPIPKIRKRQKETLRKRPGTLDRYAARKTGTKAHRV